MNLKNELEDFKLKMIDDYIFNSDENNIKAMFNQLTRKCVLAYINDDKLVYNNYYEIIQELMQSFSKEFTNIFDYVNFCFLKNLNEVLNEIMPRDFKLKTIHNPSLKINLEDESILIHNNHAMKFIERQIDYHNIIHSLFMFESFFKLKTISYEDRDMLDRLNEICSNDETLDDEIVSLVKALHKSFDTSEGRYSNEVNDDFYLYLNGDQEVNEKVKNHVQKEMDRLKQFKR